MNNEIIIYHGSPNLWEVEDGREHGRPLISMAGSSTGQKSLLQGSAWYGTSSKENAKHYGSQNHAHDRLIEIAASFGFSRGFSAGLASGYQAGLDVDKFIQIANNANEKHILAGCGSNDEYSVGDIGRVWDGMQSRLHLYTLSMRSDHLALMINGDMAMSDHSDETTIRVANVLQAAGIVADIGPMTGGEVAKLLGVGGRANSGAEAALVAAGVPGIVKTDGVAAFRGVEAISYAVWDQSFLDGMTVASVEISPVTARSWVKDAVPMISKAGGQWPELAGSAAGVVPGGGGMLSGMRG